MSNIQENLQAIESAAYGRDVRQAIHDAIRDCYDDGKAGATDLRARDGVEELRSLCVTRATLAKEVSERENGDAVLEARINGLITEVSPIAGYLETTLYENASGARGTGTEISLSDNITKYDYLDFYINSGTFYTNSEQFEDEISSVKSVSGKSYKIRTVNTRDLSTDVCRISVGEMQISLANTKVTITKHMYTHWSNAGSGQDSGYVSRVVQPNTSATWLEAAGAIVKIVGRKTVTTSEISDARIGADGTVYDSIGDAIREQVGAITSGMNVELDLTGVIIFTNAEVEGET